MRNFGLIGFPLEHSFSKSYFSNKFETDKLLDCQYINYPIDNIQKIRKIIDDNSELSGLNVTIPYKQKVIEFLDTIDNEASEVGAVNTIKIFREGKNYRLHGFNTDIYGFEKPLLDTIKPIHQSALILGTGGASKAVAYILRKHKIAYRYVSRSPKSNDVYSYTDLTNNLVSECKLIVNTSPVGMYPDIDQYPAIPYDAISPDHILYDLIYNPEKTRFLRKGEQKRATIINGLPMLYIQAEKSWEIWNA